MAENRVAHAIRQWLEQGTQEDLRVRLRALLGVDVTQSTISRIASGRQVPFAPLGVAVCIAIGLDPRSWLPLGAEEALASLRSRDDVGS